jgi:N-acetylneuraminic acid mutarotase
MRTISRLWSLSTTLLLCAMTLGMTVSSVEANVSGTISYSGNKSGRIYTVLRGWGGYNQGTDLGISVPPQATSFDIAGVPLGSQEIYAFMDTVGNGQLHASNPRSGVMGVDVSNGTGTADMTLTDPPAFTPDPPGPFNAIPTPCGTFIKWDPPRDPSTQALVADSYSIYWSTSPQFTPQTAQGGKTDIPADTDNSFFIHVASGTFYYLMTAKSGTNVSAPSAIVGPLTIPAAPGAGFTISGKVNLDRSALPGFTPTGTLYIVATDDNSKFYFSKVTAPAFTNNQEPYTITGVDNGTYFIYTFLDVNDDGLLTAGDLTAAGDGPLISVAGGNQTVPDITFKAVNAAARVTTYHSKNVFFENYSAELRVERMLKQPVNVTLTGIPPATFAQLPLNIGIDPMEGRFSYSVGSDGLAVGDFFTFDIAYPDSTDTGVQARVTGIVNSFSTPIAPRGFVVVPAQGEVTPLLTWTAPAPALAGSYTYNLWLNQQGSGGGNDGWWVDALPAGTTSVLYNFDQSGPSLNLDTVYQWSVRVRDAFGNQSELQNNYTFKPVTAIPVPQITSFWPSIGRPEGSIVTISGNNFSSDPAANQVLFFDGSANVIPATIVSADFGSLAVIVPQGAQSGPVVVRNDPSGQPVTSTETFTITPPGPPTLETFSPSSAPVGSQVTIRGVNINLLPGATTVKFSTDITATITSMTQDPSGFYELVVTVPNGAATGPVSVTTAGGTTTSYDTFTVMVPISFSGFVKSSAGTPVAGATVQVVGNTGLSAVSAADGSFTIANIPPVQTFTLKATASGFTDVYYGPLGSTGNITGRTLTLYTPSETATWGLSAGTGAITGRVIVSGGIPLQGATVNIVYPAGKYTVTYDGGGSSTGPTGVYHINGVSTADTVTVTATKAGWTFGQKTIHVYGNAVAEGNIVGAPSIPTITPVPAFLDFGGVSTGTTSYMQYLTFTNTGTATLSVTASAITGPDAGMFSAMPAGYNPCPTLPADFAPGQSCTLGVTFSPTFLGMMSATLTVTSNDPAAPTLSVPLNGTGSQPPLPGISWFSPTNGMTGTQVTIYGYNFDTIAANNTVQFNGTTATVTYADYSQLVVTVPFGATTGPITVTTSGGTTTGGLFTVSSATTFKSSMPFARHSAATGVANGILYVAGGNDGSHETATLQVYDPATDGWSTLAAMPGGRYGGNGADVINGKIYVAGGWDNTVTWLPHRELFAYDLAAGTWSTLANLPTLSACGATGAINGKLYVTTACDGYSGYRNLLHAYDPTTNAWSGLASSPSAHAGPAAGVIDGKFYLAGGADGAGNLTAQLDVYDPTTNSWTTRSPLPVAGMNFSAAVADGKLYVAGGTNASGNYFDAIYEYNPLTDSWKSAGSLQTQRSSAAAGVVGGTLYVAGGTNASGLLATTEAFTPPVAPVPPTITSFTPDSGPMDTAVTITGTGFGASSMGSSVQFNGYYAYTFTSWSDTQIVALVPSIAMGSGPITVTTPGGTATSSSNFTVTQQTYLPVITSFSPTAAAAGSQVVITGSNFDYNMQNVTVRFNGLPATVTYATWDMLVVTVPNGVTSGPITVTTTSGTATSSSQFTVSALTSYTDSAAFSAAFPAATGVDFENISTTGGKAAITGNEYGPLGINFSVSSGAGMWVYPSTSYWNTNHLSPGAQPYGYGDDNWDSLTITLNPPVTAIGWDFVDLGGGYGEGIRVYAQDNSLIYQQDFLPGTGIGSGNNPFWGLSSPGKPIARIEITEAAYDGDDVAFDNFRFIAQTTPTQFSKVLVAGGMDQTSAPPTAEMYNEMTGTWVPTANNVAYATIPTGGIHAANMTLLGNGKVLIAGGGGGDNHNTTNAASIYDPATNQWSAAASMAYGRNQLALLPLADGNALAVAGCAGGCSGPNALGQYLYGGVGNSAEIYSATGNTWAATAPLTSVRGNLAQGSNYQGAIRLQDNRVLVCGGSDGFSTTWSSCEIFDPAANTWTATGSFPEPGVAAKALLPNGKVLAVLNQTTGAVLFDPATGIWSVTGAPLSTQISGQLTVLGTGEVLLSGGYNANLPLNTAQIYTPATGTWRPAAPMGTSRYGHAATLLTDGKVLVAGGASDFVAGQWVPTTSAELFDPATGTWSPTGSMSQPRYFANAALLPAAVATAATASGTYTYTPATSTLTWNWTASSFPCDGPSLGPETKMITSLTATTLSWIDGTDTMTWTRSNGTSGDIIGTWYSTDPSTNNSYQLTFNADGTMSVTGTINRCGGDGGPANPIAQVVNNTGGPLFQATVGGVTFTENLSFCGDGCSTGFIDVPAGSNQLAVQQSAPSAPTTIGSLGNFANGNKYAVNIRNVGGYCAELWQRFDTNPIFNSDTTRTLVATTCGGTGDTQAPTVPTGVTATAVNANRVDVNWNISTDNVGVTYYQVYRNGLPAGTPAGPTNTFWPDTFVGANTTYSYTVAACDAAGNCSAQSSPFSVTTPSGGATVPTISGFSPASGPMDTQVTITGSGFGATSQGTTAVRFNGQPAGAIISWTDSQIVALVPSTALGSGPISVTTAGGTATSSGNFTVTQTSPQPQITSFAPNNGAVGGTVTIFGTNLDPVPANNTVRFNGVQATVTAANTGSLTVIVPPGATTGAVSVTTGAGTGTSSVTFAIITSITYTGSVKNSSGTAVAGATVEMAGNPAIVTTTDASGNFTLTGLPVASPFALKMSAAGYLSTYTHQNNAYSNVTPSAAYNLYTAAEVASWGVSPGRGVIRSRVSDSNNANLIGAVVTATSALHPAQPYQVVYSPDGATLGGGSTFGNSMYFVLNVDEGDTVTLTASRPGWSFATRTFLTHAGAVSQARIVGTSVIPGDFPVAQTSGREMAIGAAFDGTNFLAGIQGDSNAPHNVTAQLLSQSGTPIGPRIVTGRTGGAPQVAFDGANYLLIWEDDAAFPNDVIYGRFITPAGTLSGPAFPISTTSGPARLGTKGLIYDGTNYFVTWETRSNPDDGNTADLYGRFVSPAGQLVGNLIAISTAPDGQRDPAVAFDGTNILVAWADGRDRSACSTDAVGTTCYESDIYGQFITKSTAGGAGALSGGNFPISQSSLPHDNPVGITFDGTNYLVTFHEETTLPNACPSGICDWNIYGQLVSTAGTPVGSRIAISTASGNQLFPIPAFDGTNYLITWTSGLGGPVNQTAIKGRFMTTAGAFSSPEFTLFSGASDGRIPFVAGSGGSPAGGYFALVNWGTPGVNPTDFDSFTNADVYGAFIARNSVAGAGILAVSPAPPLDFSTVPAGGSSPAQVITFSNAGTGALTVQQSYVTGNAQDFIIQSGGPNPCPDLPALFAPGQSCTLTATFAPTATGARNATMVIVSDASNGTMLNVNLTGTGTATQVAPLITSGNTAAFTVGAAGAFTVTATGNPAPSLNETGTLPAGVTFNPATGVLSGTPAAVAAGTYTISFTATNGVAPAATQNFTLTVNYANTTPSLSVSTLGDGSVTRAATLNITGTATSVNGIKSLTVNGSPLTVNAGTGSFSTAITLAEGANTISVVATDMANQTTSDTRTITLDTQAPVLTIAAPADNSVVATSSVTATGSVDTTATVTATVNNGSPQSASMTGNNFSITLNLAAGQNTIDITAADLAGNSNTTKRTITYDPTAPSLQVTNPAQDVTITQPTLLLAGTVSDTYSGVTVTVSMDGQTYNPTVSNGAFQQQLTFSTSKQYAITVTATDQAGTTATVQRNVIVTLPSGAMVDLGKVSGSRGKQVIIPITLTNVAGADISTLRIDIGYDTALLLNPTVTPGPAGASKQVVSSAPSTGVFRVGIYDTNNTVLGNGILANVTFTISPTATIGSDLSLSNTPSASNPVGADIMISGTNGTVSVIPVSGDCNGDSSVTPGEFTNAINRFMGRAAAGTSCISFYGNVDVTPGYFTKVINAFMGR